MADLGSSTVHGDLRVKGPIYSDGSMVPHGMRTLPKGDGNSISYWTGLKEGNYFCLPDTITGQPSQWGIIHFSKHGTDFNVLWFTQSSGTMYRKSGNASINSGWVQIWDSSSFNPANYAASSHTHSGYAASSHTHGSLTSASVNTLYTNYGYISFGPQNSSWAHIYTDRANFYFNKPLYVNGTVVSLSGHTHNYAAASHSHSYLPLSGGTVTGATVLGNGRLRVQTTGSGDMYIDNAGGNSTDVTLRPSITDRGNVGTTAYRFDVVRGRVMSSSSNRSSKENINIFDEETAYEQIKDMPIYTFSFEHDSYVDHNIGTMIEYMPVEMLETGKEIYVKPGEEKMYSLNNAIFYLMAGFKVAQRKIEDLEEENRDLKSRLERLEEIVLGEEI